MQWSVEASHNQEFAVHASMYGKVCLRHGRRLRRASARHTHHSIGFKARSDEISFGVALP